MSGSPNETAGERVYQNSLIFTEIVQRLDAKKDVVTCMILSKSGMYTAVQKLYHTVKAEQLNSVWGADCALGRFVTYASAVHTTTLNTSTFPADLNLSLRNRYPNLQAIQFPLPIDEAGSTDTKKHMSLSTVYLCDSGEEAGTEDGGNPDKKKVEGELHLVCDKKPQWKGVDLSSPCFAIHGDGKRFKLSGLAVGPYVPLEQSPGHTSWKVMDGVLDLKSNQTTLALLGDLKSLEIRTFIKAADLITVFDHAPKIRHISLCIPWYCGGGDTSESLTERETRSFYSILQSKGQQLRSISLRAYGGRLESIDHSAILKFHQCHKLVLHYIPPGRPSQGCYLSKDDVYPTELDRGRAGPLDVTMIVESYECDDSDSFASACKLLKEWPASTAMRFAYINGRGKTKTWGRSVLLTRDTLLRAFLHPQEKGWRLVPKAD